MNAHDFALTAGLMVGVGLVAVATFLVSLRRHRRMWGTFPIPDTAVAAELRGGLRSLAGLAACSAAAVLIVTLGAAVLNDAQIVMAGVVLRAVEAVFAWYCGRAKAVGETAVRRRQPVPYGHWGSLLASGRF